MQYIYTWVHDRTVQSVLLLPAARRRVFSQFVAMANLRVCSLVLLSLFCSATILQSVEAQKTTLLFAFGDSFVDVGNTDKTGNFTGQGYKPPYGISWPNRNGAPAGRFSDGKVLTDWIKDLLQLPSYPPPYHYSDNVDISSGVNFAVGGAGTTLANNPTSFGVQVDNLERLQHTDRYYEWEALLNSVTIVSFQVDDYLTFHGETLAEFYVFLQRVIDGIQANLQRLFDNGLRNVIVTNVYNVDCSPLATASHDYEHCADPDAEPFIKIHNAYLLGAVQSINALNAGARFIVVDEHAAVDKLLHDHIALGFTEGLKPCCTPTTNMSHCGDVDPETGALLYTVCKNRAKAVFWDELHPTMYAWNYIVNLYANEPGYIHLADAPTLKQWLQINDNMLESEGAPYSPPNETMAYGALQVALHVLLEAHNYSEVIGLVSSFDLDTLLIGDLLEPVTVFIPTDEILTDPGYRPYLDDIFAQNKVNDIVLNHVFLGYYDLAAILASKPTNFTTLSGRPQSMSYSEDGVFVGPDLHMKVIDPDVYVVPGLIAVHGIDHVLIPDEYFE